MAHSVEFDKLFFLPFSTVRLLMFVQFLSAFWAEWVWVSHTSLCFIFPHFLPEPERKNMSKHFPMVSIFFLFSHLHSLFFGPWVLKFVFLSCCSLTLFSISALNYGTNTLIFVTSLSSLKWSISHFCHHTLTVSCCVIA